MLHYERETILEQRKKEREEKEKTGSTNAYFRLPKEKKY
jgi:hypothetical protein